MAGAAGVSKPMLYAYFGSKEGLYLDYLARAGHELIERLERVFVDDDPTPVHLRSRVDTFLAFVEEYRDGWRVLWREANASAPGGPGDRPAARRRSPTRCAGCCWPARRRRCSHRAAAEAAAHSIVGAGEALANWWLDRPEVPREQVAEWYAAVVQATVARDRPLRLSAVRPGRAGRG